MGMKSMSLREYLCYAWVQQWILQAFRTGSNICFIAVVREIAHAMGTEKFAVLPLFDAFTGSQEA